MKRTNDTTDRFSLLVVDDDPSVISTLKRIFMEDDYRLLTAYNGTDALQLLAQQGVDAALLDLKMPGLSEGRGRIQLLNFDRAY